MADQPETLFAVAQSLEKQGDWAGAADQYRAVLAAQSDFLEAHHNLAIALRHLDQTDEALLYARSAAEIAPDHPTVQFSLGVSLEHEKEIEAAIEAYKRSVDLRPNYVTALNNLGRLLEVTGQIPESLEYLERALAMAPSNQSVRLNLANSYLQGGHPKNSLKIPETLALESPELSIAHNSLGVAAHIIGDQPQSILHFRDAIKCEPDFAEAHENLAQALLFEEEYEEAWAEYEWRWQNDSNT
jgi:tetratricopeptide (TPR) repeat protein